MASHVAPGRKILMIILDGLGDLPHPALGGDTPLEAASTPHLDAWVEQGLCGLVDPIEPGTTVETHTGTGPLFGLPSAHAEVLARGPIEAAGAGLDLAPGDVALRCNFATLVASDGELTIRDRRAGRIREGAAELAAAVNAIGPEDGITTFLEPLSQHRAVLRISGPGLSAAITDTDPGVGVQPQILRWSEPVRAGDDSAERTAAALNRFLRRAQIAMAAHPVNRQRAERGLPEASGLLTRGAGMVRPVLGLIEELDLRGAVVAGDRTVLGLGALLGLRPVYDVAFTALLDTDLEKKIAVTKETLADNDIVWLHVKGTDIASHDRQPDAKRAFLERVDEALGALVGADVVLGVTADHSTDCNTGCHTSDPVPSLVYVPGGRRDACDSFGERACMRGGLGRLRASEFLRVLLSTGGAIGDRPAPPAGDVAPPRRDAHPDGTRTG